MMAMKLAVGCCTEESQGTLLRKAYNILSSTTQLGSLLLPLSNLEALQSIPHISDLSCKDEWLISLFASVVIALRPQTAIPDVGALIRLFTVFLLKGHLPAAQALASMINKWPTNISRPELLSTYKLEETINAVLQNLLAILSSSPLKDCIIVNDYDDCYSFSSACSFQVHGVVGLAWIGKSLLMRGHERVKEIAMLLLKYLLSNQDVMTTLVHMDESEKVNGQDVDSHLTRAAADAFHILLSDSEVCLNKKFHATIRPLYKQRFYSSMMPILLLSINESKSSSARYLHTSFFCSLLLLLVEM